MVDLVDDARTMQARSKPRMRRRSSLFEFDRPLPTRTCDPGVSVMTHADFPVKLGTRINLAPVESPSRPNEQQPRPGDFNIQQITAIIRETLENGLSEKKYCPKDCSPLTRELVNTLKEKVCDLCLPGYKLICTCHVTKRASPAPIIESGCAWDEAATSINRDKLAEYVYRNGDLLAVGTVFGVHGRKAVAQKFRKTSKIRVKDIAYSPIPEG